MLILASGSPRRYELMQLLLIPFRAEPALAPERPPASGEDPAGYALELARTKASEVAGWNSESVVLAADTVVAVNGEILGKPVDDNDAIRMLLLLRGRPHAVVTAVVVRRGTSEEYETVQSRVWMKDSSRDELTAYVATGEPMDKAGAYAIQGLGNALVAGYSGCFNNIVGLPLCSTSRLLSALSVPVRLASDVDPHVP